jgi:two-component system nitrogen regulation sensor histidine kinase NtrY
MRVLLYRNLQPEFSPAALTGAGGAPRDAANLAPFIESIRRDRREITRIVGNEYLHAIPLPGRDGDLLAILLVGGSRADLLLESFIRRLGLGVGAAGVLLALVLAWWATARITRPVHELADAAREVAAGNWRAHVDVRSGDEIGELAAAFNQMTRELLDQRERLVQSERVAAWRELARRLAHELKNPLFPLQITIENMQRARDRYPDQFDEVFRESCQTLLAELANLKSIVSRFSDFSKMPQPERQPVDLNGLVREVMKLFEAQLAEQNVTPRVELDANLPAAEADPAQIRRALQNLVLNALDAMPSGGALTVRTARAGGGLRIEVADTGSGLTPEECGRLFTPYYTTKQHGTGLGLAIVQSVVSDHGGTITVESQPGKGATFRIELKNGTSSHH